MSKIIDISYKSEKTKVVATQKNELYPFPCEKQFLDLVADIFSINIINELKDECKKSSRLCTDK